MIILVAYVVGQLGTEEVGGVISAPADAPEESLETMISLATKALEQEHPDVRDVQQVGGWQRYEIPDVNPGTCPWCWQTHGCDLDVGHEGDHICALGHEDEPSVRRRGAPDVFDFRTFGPEEL